ncbi:MAG: hypothetical protein ABSA75_03450 [Candidatus Bathyarchaeia archaeon]|jgi:hypothetical protein
MNNDIPKKMTRRTVKTIKETFEPKGVFDLIISREYSYPLDLKPNYPIHDRAGMALSYLTFGRVTEIFGGLQYRRVYVSGLYPDPRDPRNWKEEVIGKHEGITRENVKINENFLEIITMPIVKRSSKVIAKYGQQIAERSSLKFPLKRGLYNNAFYDQLVPFAWLVLEYLETCAPAAGKLFHYQDARAWTIIKDCTGKFPNWFRAQSDRFYKQCLFRGDVIGYAIFAGRTQTESTMSYQRFSWNADLKDPTLIMNFTWIDPAVEQIKSRIQMRKQVPSTTITHKEISSGS